MQKGALLVLLMPVLGMHEVFLIDFFVAHFLFLFVNAHVPTEHGCSWNENSCRYVAARRGHLHVLQWMLGQQQWQQQLDGGSGGLSGGGGWDAHTCHCAASGGHLQVLKFLRSCNSVSYSPFSSSPSSPSHPTSPTELPLPAMPTAPEVPVPVPICAWDEECCLAGALSGHLETLKWMRSEAVPVCPWDRQSVLDAVLSARGMPAGIQKGIVSFIKACPS